MYKHKGLLEKAATAMMSLIAEAGNEKSNFFEHMFKPYANNTFRTIMYPYRDKKDIPDAAFLHNGRSNTNTCAVTCLPKNRLRNLKNDLAQFTTV
jgi:isopenicillin N synthase-like dioxygenase